MTQTNDWKAETVAEVYRPFAMVKIELPTSTVRFFSGVGELTWDSQTWTGAGDLGFIGKIEGATELRAGKVDIGVSGLNSTVKADALNELSRGADVYIYQGFFASDHTIVADPWLAFFGKVDQSAVTEDGEGVSITISVIDGVGSRLRRTQRRRTDADQQEIYSGDKIYEFVADNRYPLNWGGPGSGRAAGSSGGRSGAVTTLNDRLVAY
jgi:hypothetical protein